MIDRDEGRGLLHNHVNFQILRASPKKLDFGRARFNSEFFFLKCIKKIPTLRRHLVSADGSLSWRNLREIGGSRSHIILYQTILIRRNLFRKTIQRSCTIVRIHESHGQSNAFGILVLINILCFASQFFLYKIRIASAVVNISIMIIFFIAASSTPLALTFASGIEILVFLRVLVF